MNKFASGVGSGGQNRDGFRVPKCFHQVFRSTGHMCNLGTSGMESENLRRRWFDCPAFRELMRPKSHSTFEVSKQIDVSYVYIVRVGNNVSAILRIDGGEPMAQRLETGYTWNGVNQRSSSSNILCANAASIIAFRGLLMFSAPSRLCEENPPKCSMIALAVFTQLNYGKWKQRQRHSW